MCTHVALAHGCAAEVTIEPGYPVTVNDPGAASRVVEVATGVLGGDRVADMPSPIMGAEDFSYVLAEIPGALAFLGGARAGTDLATVAPNHSNRVVFDESAMSSGVALYAALALHGAP